MDLLKSIYEFFGTPYPRLSLVLVTILGAAAAFSVWSFAARQVEKDHKSSSALPQVSGPASTAGVESPAVTGSGNSIRYEQPSDPHEKTKPPKKE